MREREDLEVSCIFFTYSNTHFASLGHLWWNLKNLEHQRYLWNIIVYWAREKPIMARKLNYKQQGNLVCGFEVCLCVLNFIENRHVTGVVGQARECVTLLPWPPSAPSNFFSLSLQFADLCTGQNAEKAPWRGTRATWCYEAKISTVKQVNQNIWSRGLDFGQFLFFSVVMDRDGVEVHNCKFICWRSLCICTALLRSWIQFIKGLVKLRPIKWVQSSTEIARNLFTAF